MGMVLVICTCILSYLLINSSSIPQHSNRSIDTYYISTPVSEYSVLPESKLLIEESGVYSICADTESLWITEDQGVCWVAVESPTRPTNAVQRNFGLKVDQFSKTIYSSYIKEDIYRYYFLLKDWTYLYIFNTMYDFPWLITPNQFIIIK